MYYSTIVSREMMCFFRLMLVSAFLIVLVGSSQFSQASTTEGDPSSEVKQQEHSNPSVNSAAELKKQPATANHGGLLSSNEKQSSIIDKLYQKIDHVQYRFSNLLAYGTPLPPKRQHVRSDDSLWKNELVDTPLQFFALIGSIFFTALCIEQFFRRYMVRFIAAVTSQGNIKWFKKISALMARVALDIAGLLIFLLIVTSILLFLPSEFRPSNIVISSCLTAILIVKMAAIFSRALLAVDFHQLRLLPITTDAARYIQHRVLAIASIGAFGWLSSGFIGLFSRLQSVSFLSFIIISILVCCVLIIMCLEKRTTVRNILQIALPKNNVMQEVARVWHHLAVFYVLTIWFACFLGLLLIGPKTIIPAGLTILAIPFFFIMDWLLQTLVDWWLHFSKNQLEPNSESACVSADLGEAKWSEPAQPAVTLGSKTQLYSEGFAFGLRFVIRVVLAALLFFNLLSLWGIDLQIGKVLTNAAMSVIVVTLVCVIIWGIANRLIERKIKEELPDQDEEEEGGSGGSRTGTLLLLFRKFLLSFLFIIGFITVLSSLGINIGPLIAGAGVIGLAIGFGAQTLVRDIISGIFFLMDDAFRVGDFVDTGSSQGVVEHISLRSLRIRHSRGMVHTIPFGDIPSSHQLQSRLYNHQARLPRAV